MTSFAAPISIGSTGPSDGSGTPAPPITLRPFDPSEAALLGARFAAIPPWARYPFEPEALAAYLGADEAGAPRYAITSGDRLAGAVGLRLAWLRGPYLQFLGILPEFQGQNLGGAVLAWMEREARRAGHRNLWVAASDFNTGAVRFYCRHGFSEVARLDALIQEGRTELLLRKRLD
jgi:GNAT superfamily N-acetyltransferase